MRPGNYQSEWSAKRQKSSSPTVSVIRIKGQWQYLYRAVDQEGQTLDFLLTAQRDKPATLRFLKKAVRQHDLPEKVTIDKSGAHTAALEALQKETGAKIESRQIKYLNNLVEQDHRAVKRIVRPILGFHKPFTRLGSRWQESNWCP